MKVTKTSDGTFRSRFESTIAADLRVRKVPYEYESEKFVYYVERTYSPDFILANGILVEAKGYFLTADQRKMRAIKEQHPDRDFRMVFQNLNGRVQGSKMTCADWCEKYGFLYADKVIPKDWIDE